MIGLIGNSISLKSVRLCFVWTLKNSPRCLQNFLPISLVDCAEFVSLFPLQKNNLHHSSPPPEPFFFSQLRRVFSGKLVSTFA